MNKEVKARSLNGIGMLMLLLVLLAVGIGLAALGGASSSATEVVAGIALIVVTFILMSGFFIVEPNGSTVLLLFGRYVGTERGAGFHWASIFYSKRHAMYYEPGL